MEEPQTNGEIDLDALRKDGGGIEYLMAALVPVALVVAVVVSAKPVEQQRREGYGAECWDAKKDAAAVHRKLDSLDRAFLREPKEGENNAETREKYLVKRGALDREYVEKAMLWKKCMENKRRNTPVAAQPKAIPRARSQL